MTTREEIIRQVIDMFNEYGLELTMDDVAEKMHVSKKTLYKLFASKEEMMLAVTDHAFTEIYDLKRELAKSSIPLKERLPLVMKAMPEELKNFDFSKLAGIGKQYPEVSKRVNKYLTEGWEPVIELLEEGEKEGIFNKVDINVLRICYSSTIDAFMESGGFPEAEMDYQQSLNELLNFLMNGIVKEK